MGVEGFRIIGGRRPLFSILHYSYFVPSRQDGEPQPRYSFVFAFDSYSSYICSLLSSKYCKLEISNIYYFNWLKPSPTLWLAIMDHRKLHQSQAVKKRPVCQPQTSLQYLNVTPATNFRRLCQVTTVAVVSDRLMTPNLKRINGQ